MDQQNNQITLPRRSRRLATIIPASHWISMGYSEEDAELMEKLQIDMKKCCDGEGEISSSLGDLDESFIVQLSGRNNGALPHHDILIPHWQKLFKSLKGRTNVEFSISGISLPTSVLDIAFPALRSVDLNLFVLSGVSLDSDGHQLLSSFLGNNSSLEGLVLANDVMDITAATSLSDALSNHSSLERIAFGYCGLKSNDILTKILEGCKSINKLILVNDIGSESVDVLADFIRSNHSVECLDLSTNNITDDDTLLLALALKTNTHLKELDLQDNSDITAEGERALMKAMFDPTSMGSIVDSNHVCKAYSQPIYDFVLSFPGTALNFNGHPPKVETEVFYIAGLDISVEKKIRKKVVLALCGLEGEIFDLSHFNDLPLGVMPRVLELIQEHAISRVKLQESRGTLEQLEKDALSRLFHTLRGWELPSLFVNLNTPPANVSTGKRKRRKTRRY